jgi:exosome complex RNA-binding protein Rrp4
MKVTMNLIKARLIYTIIKNSYLYKMEYIRVNKICKAQEKDKENVNGVMDLIMMEVGKMDKEMVQECSSRGKESNIKENGRMIKSMEEVL